MQISPAAWVAVAVATVVPTMIVLETF